MGEQAAVAAGELDQGGPPSAMAWSITPRKAAPAASPSGTTAGGGAS